MSSRRHSRLAAERNSRRPRVLSVLLVAACVAIVALLASRPRRPQPAPWPVVRAVIQDTRIVADHAVETPVGGETRWKAEYILSYSVANRPYSVWVDSGIRGESKPAVQLILSQSRPSCRVRYNPQAPEVSVASCR